jgi:hypothetical protein
MQNKLMIPKILCAALVAAAITFNVSSCKKDSTSTTTSSSTVTEADAAELTTDAVMPTTNGMTTQLSSSVTIYKTVSLSCGVQKDSTITKVSAAGATPSYNYSFSWDYMLTCNGLVPSELTLNFTGAGNYSGSRLSTTDKGTGGFVLTGLGAASSQYLLNATYTRTGTSTSKIGKLYTFNSTLSIKSTNLAVDKVTEQIVSGTATVSITATSTSGKSFTFNGTLTFLGNKKANLVLNSGTSYTIQWS